MTYGAISYPRCPSCNYALWVVNFCSTALGVHALGIVSSFKWGCAFHNDLSSLKELTLSVRSTDRRITSSPTCSLSSAGRKVKYVLLTVVSHNIFLPVYSTSLRNGFTLTRNVVSRWSSSSEYTTTVLQVGLRQSLDLRFLSCRRTKQSYYH